jgi:two-component system phosphate regulon sensor histidine kinase PhoR
MAEIDRRVHYVRGGVLAATSAGLLVTLVATFLLARYVTGPLTTVTEGALEIAAGHAAPDLPVDTQDELGALARAFTAMSEQLRGRLDTITTDRNKFQAILASMVEGVVAVDGAGRVVHLNEVAGRLLGVNPYGSLGRPMQEVARRPEVLAALRRTLDDAQPSTAEVPQGIEQVFKLHTTPLRTGDGQVAGALLVIHDVSELRRLERVRRDFVANVSHELKTPLTAIQCLIENLLDDREMDPPQRQRFLEKVDNQCRRLTNLVKDLLVLSRVESEESALVRVPLDLRLPIEDSVAALQGTAEEKRLQLRRELPAQPLLVRGDREGLRQVVDNLVGNALTYTPAGGRVVVRLREDALQAVLEVEDTGIGIEPEHQERIFERFYRVDKGRSREVGGTGLGLSIVKHVTIAHQGEVSLRSEPGRGSTFRVTIPLLGQEEAAAAAEGRAA